MYKSFISFFTLCILLAFPLTGCTTPEAKFKITVVDDNGSPIEKVKVDFLFRDYYAKGPGRGWGTVVKLHTQTLFTDKKGFCTATGKINFPSKMTILLKKDGYYDGFTKFPGRITSHKILNRWEPWPCEVTVKLRKIKDPVPMCLKTHDFFKVPEHGKKFGYDLKVGDLLAPYGKGKTADFYILVKKYQDEKKQWHFPVYFSFDRKGDGMQEIKVDANLQSTFVWPYMAPEKGFLQAMDMGSKILGETTGLSTLKTKSYFVLRTRTRLDEKGNVISANYTRFDRFYSNGYEVNFSYAFNPNNKSRSLEFNGKNSFKDRDQYGRKLMSR